MSRGRRSIATLVAGALTVAALAAPSVVHAKKKKPRDPVDETPLAPGVRAEAFEGGVRIDVVLDDPLIGWALPKLGDGERAVVLLTRAPAPGGESPGAPDTGTDDGPCDPRTSRASAVYRLDTGDGEPSLELLRDDLPPDAGSLDAWDVDADGVDELLLFRPGEALALELSEGGAAVAPPELLFADPDLKREGLFPTVPRPGLEIDRDWLQVAGVGVARYYRRDPGTNRWARVSEVELPKGAAWQGNQVRIQSPEPFFVGHDAAGDPLFATRAGPHGEQRLQAFVIRPRDGDVAECWARLPEPEWVMPTLPHLLDGRPVLVAVTINRRKAGPFSEQSIRIFPLERDRSRHGVPPSVSLATRVNNIHRVWPFFHDLDGDGREDLIVGHYKGFDNGKAVLDVYMREQDGTFSSAPRSTAVTVEEADPTVFSYGADPTGDGLSDLVLLTESHLLVFAGATGAKTGKAIVGREPWRSAPLGRTVTRKEEFESVWPIVTRLDEDGPGAVVVAREEVDGRGVISLFVLSSP